MNWKELFDEDRLNRGYDYYISDKVFDVILTDNSILSKVEGSHSNIYEVKITFKDNKIDSLYCTCPYSFADFNCKHMVATLYKKEEIQNNTKKSISDKGYNKLSQFSDILKNIDDIKLRRYIYDKFYDDEDFVKDFINKFKEDFSPEDFYHYENMLENIFNIDVVELYNENGFYQDAPFNKYLKSFIEDKINSLYKKEEYDYVLQLLYIIYENISSKINVNKYIEVDDILESCNYYLIKIIESQSDIENEEILNYLLNKIIYDYNENITPYFIDICINFFTKKQYLQQLNSALDKLIEDNILSNCILLNKYNLLQKLEYPLQDQRKFLEEYRFNEDIMNILVEEEIKKHNINKAIELLNENKKLHGDIYSLENNLLLFELYKINNDTYNAIEELKNILYDYFIKDITYVEQLKTMTTNEEWNVEKLELIEFYEETNSYDFLNQIYLLEKEYDNLFKNIIDHCSIDVFEDYKEYLKEEYSEEILEIYRKFILKSAMNSKNISGYTLIIHYLGLMLTYSNSSTIVINIISTLKNKYKQRKLFMEKLEEFEILNSL